MDFEVIRDMGESLNCYTNTFTSHLVVESSELSF